MQPSRTVPLAPLDYVYFEKPQYTMNFVFDFAVQQDFDAMRAALPATLEKFYPLKGRVRETSQGKYQIVECDGEFGAVPFECQELPKEREPNDTKGLLAFSQSVGAGAENPLAKFVLYQAKNRSILSASISHGIADGFSYFYFLASWAAATRGVAFPGPAHGRERVRHDGNDFGDLSVSAIFERTGYSMLDRPALTPPRLKSYDRIFLSEATLSEQRERTEKELGQKLSRNDVISALLLKDCAGRWHKPGDTIRLTCQLDTRRLLPQITPMFFGNAMRGASFDATYDEVVDGSVGRLAAKVQQAVAKIGRAETEDCVRCIQGVVELQGLEATRRLHVWHPDRGMLVSNLTKMPLEQVNFGRGAPHDFFPAGSHSPRTYILLTKPGGVEAFVGI